jgi:protein LTV1
MDDDFDFEDPNNELEDDFMELAMGGQEIDGEFDEEDEDWIDEEDEDADIDSDGAAYSDEEDDEIGPLPKSRNFPTFDNEETKSRFTEYSMSSSVIRRNEQLTLLDDKFEKFFEDYDDQEVGALDCEEIEGHVDIDEHMLSQLSEDFKKKQLPVQYEKAWDICRMVKVQQEEEEKPEEMVILEVSDDENKKKWDCESVLSTFSNIYNHPKLIEVPSKKKIQINPKTGIPKNVLNADQGGRLTEKTLAKLNSEQTESTSGNAGPKSLCAESVLTTLSVLSIRPKDETPEEKRERKKLLKEYRNERRIEKKANKIAFNDERMRQHSITMNQKNNLQGNKIL